MNQQCTLKRSLSFEEPNVGHEVELHLGPSSSEYCLVLVDHL